MTSSIDVTLHYYVTIRCLHSCMHNSWSPIRIYFLIFRFFFRAIIAKIAKIQEIQKIRTIEIEKSHSAVGISGYKSKICVDHWRHGNAYLHVQNADVLILRNILGQNSWNFRNLRIAKIREIQEIRTLAAAMKNTFSSRAQPILR